MKRFHVHVNVQNLDTSIGYYAQLFGAPPTVVKRDYAKWMLEDPRVNFAISQRGRMPGLDHLGIQVETADELDQIGARLRAADAIALSETATTCCYARSDKHWSNDPQGLRWETFRSLGDATTYAEPSVDGQACCRPVNDDISAHPGKSTCAPQASSSEPCCGNAN